MRHYENEHGHEQQFRIGCFYQHPLCRAHAHAGMINSNFLMCTGGSYTQCWSWFYEYLDKWDPCPQIYRRHWCKNLSEDLESVFSDVWRRERELLKKNNFRHFRHSDNFRPWCDLDSVWINSKIILLLVTTIIPYKSCKHSATCSWAILLMKNSDGQTTGKYSVSTT